MGIQIPSSSPSDNPLTPILINPQWMPILIGLCVDNLLFRDYWEGTGSEVDDAIDYADELIYLLSIPSNSLLMLSFINSSTWLLESASGLFEAYDSSNVIASFDPPSPDSFVSLKHDTNQQTVIDSVGTSTQQLGENSGLQNWAAQSFLGAGRYLSAIKINFSSNVGTPTGTMTWELRTDASNNPSSTILQQGTFTPSPNVDNTITITDGVFLDNGVLYWIVLRCTSDQTSGNAYRIRLNSGNPYADGKMKRTTNGGSSWLTVTSDTSDIRMTVTSLTTPTKDKLAQRFIVGIEGDLDTARLQLKKQGSPIGNLTVKLYSDSGGEPDSLLATSNTVGATTLGTSFAWVSFTFSTPYALTKDTLYWLVLETSDSASSSNYVEWQGQSST